MLVILAISGCKDSEKCTMHNAQCTIFLTFDLNLSIFVGYCVCGFFFVILRAENE